MKRSIDKAVEHCADQWEANAQADAAFAVLTDDAAADHKWNLDDFLERGVDEIDKAFAFLQDKSALPSATVKALDFGCGAGRLTAALGSKFGSAVGVDVSEAMVAEARQNVPAANVRFVHNRSADLSVLDPEQFDFIYSNIVLQHIPQELQLRYIGEFCRLLAPGGIAMFQTASYRSGVRGRIERTVPPRVLSLLRAASRGPRSHRRSDYSLAMEMNCLTDERVTAEIERSGRELVHLGFSNATEPDFGGRLVFVSAEEAHRRAEGGRYVGSVYVVRHPQT